MTSPRGRILCTEDDPDTRELIIFVLTDAGFDVVCSDNAEETIKLARTEVFDLYLIDNWIADVSGADLCRRLREFDTKTPVLFYTAAAYQADKDRATASGAQGYLVKPVDSNDLITEVIRLIAEAKIAFPVAVYLPEAPPTV